MEFFDHFTRWNFTPGLMPPKFTDERPMIGMAPRMIAVVTGQEIRANIGDTSVNTWIDGQLMKSNDYFVKPELNVVMETCRTGWRAS